MNRSRRRMSRSRWMSHPGRMSRLRPMSRLPKMSPNPVQASPRRVRVRQAQVRPAQNRPVPDLQAHLVYQVSVEVGR